MISTINQYIVWGTNSPQQALFPVNAKSFYECANAQITQGLTTAPLGINDCLERFPEVKKITDAIGFSSANLWQGGTACPYEDSTGCGASGPINLLLGSNSQECLEIESQLGIDWLGCLWGTPMASYSCICPEVKDKYEAYIKLRLNDATFWDTPVETPVKRAEFLDAFKYAKKIDVTIAGDFSLKLGQVVELRLNNISNYPTSLTSCLNGLYYIVGIKHSITNSGSHEMALALSQIAPINAGMSGGPLYT